MEIIDELNGELLRQDFNDETKLPFPEELERYKAIARSYSITENTLSVLSDMKTNTSHIYYGGFSRTLGLKESGPTIDSIWESQILDLVHPEDLQAKYLQELRFFRFIKRQPKTKRPDFYLANIIRMRDPSGSYIQVLHRMFYIPAPSGNSMWMALCLYGPMPFSLPGKSMVINSATGQFSALGERSGASILSERERQVLRLIEKGMSSKDIAGALTISVHTVSRHRQEILGKLKVRNSFEACRVARNLGMI